MKGVVRAKRTGSTGIFSNSRELDCSRLLIGNECPGGI